MNNIRKHVKDIIAKNATAEPFLLCDYLGIIIQIVPLPVGTYGLYLKAYGLQFIFISRMLSFEEQKVVCAHEPGARRSPPEYEFALLD